MFMKKQLTPFEVEEMRAELARKFEFDELRRMYTSEYPQITDQNSSKLWNILNLEKKPLITSNPMEDERLRIVAQLIKGVNAQILNIGFGSGNLERTYFNTHKTKKIKWFGIDISNKSVNKVQQENPEGKFSVGDIMKMKFPDDRFNYVVALEVLEHIPPNQILKALSEVFRITQPGGYFILSVPLNEGLEEMIKKGENPNAHVRVYTQDLIVAELIISGFRILNEKLLFAFNDHYSAKSAIARYSPIKRWKPNNIIILAQKPDSISCNTVKYSEI